MISSTTQVVALPIAEAYRRVTTIDPSTVYPKSGPLPAVTAVRDATGRWDAVGETHRLMLSDGGHVVERIVVADAPEHFAYVLDDFQKLFGILVRDARADWRFTAVEGGTSVRWDYEFHALPGRGWIVNLIQRFLWAPYMHRILPLIAARVEDQ